MIKSIPIKADGTVPKHPNIGGSISSTYISMENGYSATDINIPFLKIKNIDYWTDTNNMPPINYGEDVITPINEQGRSLDIYCDSDFFDDSGIIDMKPEERAALLKRRNLSGNGTKENPYKNLCYALAKVQCLLDMDLYEKCRECVSYIRVIVSGTVNYHVRVYPVDISGTELFEMTKDNGRFDGKSRTIIDGSKGLFFWDRINDRQTAGSLFCVHNTRFYNVKADIVQNYSDSGFCNFSTDGRGFDQEKIFEVDFYNCNVTTSGLYCNPICNSPNGVADSCVFINNTTSQYEAALVKLMCAYMCNADFSYSGSTGYVRTTGFSLQYGSFNKSTIKGSLLSSESLTDFYGFHDAKFLYRCTANVDIFSDTGTADIFAIRSCDAVSNCQINIKSQNIHDNYRTASSTVTCIYGVVNSISNVCTVGINASPDDPCHINGVVPNQYASSPCICYNSVFSIEGNGYAYINDVIKCDTVNNCSCHISGDFSGVAGIIYAASIVDSQIECNIGAKKAVVSGKQFDVDGIYVYEYAKGCKVNITYVNKDDDFYGTDCRGYLADANAELRDCTATLNVSEFGCYERGCSYSFSPYFNEYYDTPPVFINCSGNNFCRKAENSEICDDFGSITCNNWECAL